MTFRKSFNFLANSVDKLQLQITIQFTQISFPSVSKYNWKRLFHFLIFELKNK